MGAPFPCYACIVVVVVSVVAAATEHLQTAAAHSCFDVLGLGKLASSFGALELSNNMFQQIPSLENSGPQKGAIMSKCMIFECMIRACTLNSLSPFTF